MCRDVSCPTPGLKETASGLSTHVQRRVLFYSRLKRENLWIVSTKEDLTFCPRCLAVGTDAGSGPALHDYNHNRDEATQHRAGAQHRSGNLSRNLTSHSLRSLVSSSAGLGSRLCQWAAANDRPFRTRSPNRHALQRQPRTTGTAALTRNRLLEAQAQHSVFEK